MSRKARFSQFGSVLLAIVATLAVWPADAQAKGTPVGDIVLMGIVERDGQRLLNNTTLFAGDTLRTAKGSGSVIRFGRGRLEIAESSEVEIAGQSPLKIIVHSGRVGFNFPQGTEFEIVTPQLQIEPQDGETRLSGSINAQPEKEDRVQSRSGRFSIRELEAGGATNQIHDGQILVATLVPVAAAAVPQGPLGGTQIAILSEVQGDVRVNRAATPNNVARITAPGLALATGDRVRTLGNSTAQINFTRDMSYIRLQPGTDVTIAEREQPTGVFRTLAQAAGRLYFNIQRTVGSQTELTTPTAVAAIRGTIGEQEVIGIGSIHALNEGSEDITENLTRRTVTIVGGQAVTAIRGVGFTAITAFTSAAGGSVAGTGGGTTGGATGGTTGGTTGGATGGATGGTTGGATGGGGGLGTGAGAGAGAGGGGVASTASIITTTAATSTVTTVASVAVATAAAGFTAGVAPLAGGNDQAPASASEPPTALSLPGS